MRRVLLTGMSGTGKSAVIQALAARGFKAVDADTDEWCEWVDVPDDPDAWVQSGADWVWREDRIQRLLSTDDAEVLFVSGCPTNQVKFYPQFDQIVLLTAPASTIAERLMSRTTNAYGKDPEELARVLKLQQTVVPLLRRRASLEVDTSTPLDEVVASILAHAGVGRCESEGGSVSVEANKALVRRVFDDVYSTGDVAAIDEFFAADFARHRPGAPDTMGTAAMKEYVTRTRAVFSDLRVTVDELIGEGDQVAARVTAHALQRGPFLGIPATDLAVSIAEVQFFRIADGKVSEVWVLGDVFGLLQQLGAVVRT